MRHGSLCSGLGGFDYAAEQAGFENVFHCEKNEFCQRILNYYWKNAKGYTDIFDFDGTAWRDRVDIISAGFPCQPFSHAGKRGGDTDDRFIWKEIRRIIGQAMPGFVVLENVAGLTSILQSPDLSKLESEAYKLLQKAEVGTKREWKKRDKVAFAFETIEKRIIAQIIEDLKGIGYETPRLADGTPVILCIPACAKGAVHRRDRIWIVAYSDGICKEQRQREIGGLRSEHRNGAAVAVTDTNQRSGTSGNDTAGWEAGTNIVGSGKAAGIQAIANPESSECKQSRHTRARRTGFADSNIITPNPNGSPAEHEIPSGRHLLAGKTENVANTWSKRQPGQGQHRGRLHTAPDELGQINKTINGSELKETWLEAATRLCSVDDGTAGRLDAASISKGRWRTESLKGFGNAIYWKVAFDIFKAIEQTQALSI